MAAAWSCGEVEVFHKFDVYECDLKHDPFLLKLCRKARDSGESKESKSLNKFVSNFKMIFFQSYIFFHKNDQRYISVEALF